jgi:hypothetical protein
MVSGLEYSALLTAGVYVAKYRDSVSPIRAATSGLTPYQLIVLTVLKLVKDEPPGETDCPITAISLGAC